MTCPTYYEPYGLLIDQDRIRHRGFLIKRSTYQGGEHGWRSFGNRGRPMNPTVVLWPVRCKSKIPRPPGMQVFSDPGDAEGAGASHLIGQRRVQ